MRQIVKVTNNHVGHTCETFHTGTLIEGSHTTRLDGFPVGRVGDSFSCGDHIGDNSNTVTIDGMKIAVRGDLTAGHGCFPPTVIIGSSTAFH